jgi:predicted phage terminase large subunit-like protein
MTEDVGISCAYYFPTYDLIKLRGIVGLIKDLELFGLEYSLNKSEFTVTIIGYGNVIFRSYDSPERIVAYEVAHSIVDELDTLPLEKAEYVWRKVVERNRQPCNHEHGNTVGCVTTPDQGQSGFVFAKWGRELQDGYELIKASTYSNPFLPDDYIASIKSNYSEELAKLYLMGEFVSLNATTIIKKHHWRHWQDDVPLPKCQHIFHSYDMAVTEKDTKTASYSACTRWGVFWHGARERYCLMLLGRWYDRVGYPDLRAKVIELDKLHHPDVNLIENKSAGQSIIQDLRDVVGGVIKEYSPGKGEDKINRANSVCPIFEMGLVYVPPKKWAHEVIDLVATFPHGKPESFDITDTVTQALIYLRKARWFENHDDETLENERKERERYAEENRT